MKNNLQLLRKMTNQKVSAGTSWRRRPTTRIRLLPRRELLPMRKRAEGPSQVEEDEPATQRDLKFKIESLLN
jgi:hypothetical protein